MPPPGKKRRVEDRDYAEPSGSAAAYNSSAATTSRARALAENKAAQLAVQQEKQARASEQRDDQSPLIYMNQFPPAAIHKYLRHYNLVPLPPPLPQSMPMSGPAPINYTQAVFPTPPVSSIAFDSEGAEPEAEEGLDTLKTPAWDGQETREADGRLVEIARQHWDSVQLKEGETIVNFIYALRMKDKHIKMPTPV